MDCYDRGYVGDGYWDSDGQAIVIDNGIVVTNIFIKTAYIHKINQRYKV